MNHNLLDRLSDSCIEWLTTKSHIVVKGNKEEQKKEFLNNATQTKKRKICLYEHPWLDSGCSVTALPSKVSEAFCIFSQTKDLAFSFLSTKNAGKPLHGKSSRSFASSS